MTRYLRPPARFAGPEATLKDTTERNGNHLPKIRRAAAEKYMKLNLNLSLPAAYFLCLKG